MRWVIFFHSWHDILTCLNWGTRKIVIVTNLQVLRPLTYRPHGCLEHHGNSSNRRLDNTNEKKSLHIYFKIWHQGKLKLSWKFSNQFGFEYKIVGGSSTFYFASWFCICPFSLGAHYYSYWGKDTAYCGQWSMMRTALQKNWKKMLGFFKLRQRSRHFRLRHSRWLPENGKEFRKMKGEAACGLWKRDKNPRANKVLCICGAERFWVAKVCRSLPSSTFAGILLVLLQ